MSLHPVCTYRISPGRLTNSTRPATIIHHLLKFPTMNASTFFSFLFFSSFRSICKPLGYGRLKVSLHKCSSLASSPLSVLLCVFTPTPQIILEPFSFRILSIFQFALPATFGFTPPRFIQADLHLLGHFSAPILSPL